MSEDGLPAWATGPIEIVPADPTWPVLAASLIDDVTPMLDGALAGPVEHVGSTAVPGLAAKPVIDLLAPVTSLAAADLAAAGLAAAGWEEIPQELDLRPWRRAWVLPDGRRRRAHLHLVAHDDARAGEHTKFRDLLRADPDLRAAYEALKLRLAAAHRDDREAYSEAKTDFVREALADG